MTSASASPSSLPKNAPAPPKSPSKNNRPGTPRDTSISGRRILRKVLLLLLGIAIGALAAFFLLRKEHSAEISSELGTRVKPGPWGELYHVPFTIAAPEELLPISAIEAGGTHWWFKNTTRAELSELLQSAGLPEDRRNKMLDPEIAHFGPVDIKLTPTPEMVLSLSAKGRQILYRVLAQYPANQSAFSFIHKDTLRDRFDDSGVSKETLALFHKLCCEHGDYLVLGGLPALLSQLPNYEEKLRFMKALTRQKTMLIRLRVTKDSDLRMLSAYWGKGRWAPSIRTLLESIDRVPGSTFTSVLALLPPMPSSELYIYPTVQDTQLNSAAPVHDCHWTSLNFFRDPAETEAVDSATFAQKITTEYFPISGDPTFGDILILSTPDGEIVHSAVVIADDIVFTKNGATAIFPWMFSTVTDLMKQYSFHAPEGQQLTVRHYRNKGV